MANNKEISMNVSHIKDVNAQLIRKYQRNESGPTATDKRPGSATMITQEKVNCSTAVIEIREAEADGVKAPDVRAEKVLKIKSQVERGMYNVSGEQIACKMIRVDHTSFWARSSVEKLRRPSFPV